MRLYSLLYLATVLFMTGTIQGGANLGNRQFMLPQDNFLHFLFPKAIADLTYGYLMTDMLVPHLFYDKKTQEIVLSLSCEDNTHLGTVAIKGLHEKFHKYYASIKQLMDEIPHPPPFTCTYETWLNQLELQVDYPEKGVLCIGAGDKARNPNLRKDIAPLGLFIYDITTQQLRPILEESSYCASQTLLPAPHLHFISSIDPDCYAIAFNEDATCYIVNKAGVKTGFYFSKERCFASGALPLCKNTALGALEIGFRKHKILSIQTLGKKGIMKAVSILDQSMLCFQPLPSQNECLQTLIILTQNKSPKNRIYLMWLIKMGESVNMGKNSRVFKAFPNNYPHLTSQDTIHPTLENQTLSLHYTRRIIDQETTLHTRGVIRILIDEAQPNIRFIKHELLYGGKADSIIINNSEKMTLTTVPTYLQATLLKELRVPNKPDSTKQAATKKTSMLARLKSFWDRKNSLA